MIPGTRITDDEHDYSVSIPETTPNGQAVQIQTAECQEVHLMHAESPDQSELYFEVAAYPGRRPHGELAAEQQRFLNEHSSDGQTTTVGRQSVADRAVTAFDFRGTLQARWKERRFLFIDGPTRTYRIVYDPTSPLNDWVLHSFRLQG